MTEQVHYNERSPFYGRGKASVPQAERLDWYFSNLRKTDTGCLEWRWTIGSGGYGSLRVDGKHILTHRLSYQRYVGPIPAGMCVCHSCDNPPCVNPAHLWLGTLSDNAKDAYRKGRTQPPRDGSHIQNKLNVEQVIEIRHRYRQGESLRQIAEDYPVAYNNVWCVVRRVSWKDIP